jgi:hypothetical protein
MRSKHKRTPPHPHLIQSEVDDYKPDTEEP